MNEEISADIGQSPATELRREETLRPAESIYRAEIGDDGLPVEAAPDPLGNLVSSFLEEGRSELSIGEVVRALHGNRTLPKAEFRGIIGDLSKDPRVKHLEKGTYALLAEPAQPAVTDSASEAEMVRYFEPVTDDITQRVERAIGSIAIAEDFDGVVDVRKLIKNAYNLPRLEAEEFRRFFRALKKSPLMEYLGGNRFKISVDQPDVDKERSRAVDELNPFSRDRVVHAKSFEGLVRAWRRDTPKHHKPRNRRQPHYKKVTTFPGAEPEVNNSPSD